MPPPCKYILTSRQEKGKGVDKEKVKKMGRPTDNPKPYRSVVRMDERTNNILENYCSQKKVNKMEAIRRGIAELEKYIKK